MPGRRVVEGPGGRRSVCRTEAMRPSFETCVLDVDGHQLLRDDKPVHMETGAFEVLSRLVAARDRVATKHGLLDEICDDRLALLDTSIHLFQVGEPVRDALLDELAWFLGDRVVNRWRAPGRCHRSDR